MPFRSVLVAAAVIVAATFAAYHNSFSGPLVFDDELSIAGNPSIRNLWPPWGALMPPKGAGLTVEGRPMLNLSLAINYAFGGANVAGYHVGNLLIHTCAALALFGIVRRTLSSEEKWRGAADFVALTAAVWWAVHPLQTESVSYLIQRAESLTGLFYLLTLYCFTRGSTGWLVGSVMSCALGMATKETMVTAPLIVLLYDRAFVAGDWRSALRLRKKYYAALFGTWILLAALIVSVGGNRSGTVGFDVGIGWWEYWLTQFPAIARYLWLSVWPHPLVFEYGEFWVRTAADVLPGALLVVPLVIGTGVLFVRNRALGFLGAWFFGILAPTSLAPGTTQMIVEHRIYLSLAAVTVLGAAAVASLARSHALRVSVIVAIAGAFVVLTVRRNLDYRDEAALWRDTIAKRPANPLAHHMLAETLDRRGDTDGAIAEFTQTLRFKPDFSVAHARLGDLLLKTGRRDEAIAHYRAAIAVRPMYVDALTNLGIALAQADRLTESVEPLETAVRLAPQFVHARFTLANAYADLGRDADAAAQFEAALALEPSDARLHYSFANLLARQRRLPDAIAHYEAALRANPNFPEAHNNLGTALLETGRRDEAIAHYEAALRIAPEFADARENLARVRR